MPKRILATGLIVAAVLVAAFAFLTVRALRSLRVEAKAAEMARARALAGEEAGRALRRVERLLDREPDAGAKPPLWRLGPDGRFLVPPVPEPFEPLELPTDTPSQARFLLEEGERREFGSGDLASAEMVYQVAASAEYPDPVRRIALWRLAALSDRRGEAEIATVRWTEAGALAGDTELLLIAALAGADVDEADVEACLVRHLGADPTGKVAGYARSLGYERRPAVAQRMREVRRMAAIRAQSLSGIEVDGTLRVPLGAGGFAFLRADRVLPLDRDELAEVLGPGFLPEGAGELSGEAFGEGPLEGLRVAVAADPDAIDSTVRRQAALLLGPMALAGAAGLAALFFLLRSVGRQTDLARLKTEFVANVSHELRTPLSLIGLYAETLRRGRAPEGETEEYLTVIEREVVSLGSMIDRVLDFAKIERGAKEYRREPSDLAALVRETVEDARRRRPDLEIDLRLPPEPVPARLDAEAVKGALMNLLDNAVRHGGGKDVRVALLTAGGSAHRLEVQDRGPGVHPADAPRIFDRFHRGRETAELAVRGSGLGLTLARHAAEGHGGAARYEPRPGGGSIFSITLPRGDDS